MTNLMRENWYSMHVPGVGVLQHEQPAELVQEHGALVARVGPVRARVAIGASREEARRHLGRVHQRGSERAVEIAGERLLSA